MPEIGKNAAILPIHRTAIAAVRPDLSRCPLVLHADGWDCLVIEALGPSGAVIFKFPHHPGAADRLRCEAPALDLARAAVQLRLPRMRLHEAPLLMSEHDKIEGVPVDPDMYDRLSPDARAVLAQDLSRFFAEIHSVDKGKVRRRHSDAVRPYPGAHTVRAGLDGLVSTATARLAHHALRRHEAHGADEEVFGQFDTHGWNMAFNEKAGRLAGLFDFAGAGVGPLHRDLSYLMFVGLSLTRDVVGRYQVLAGRSVDLRRVVHAHAALRAIELWDEIRAGHPAERFEAALVEAERLVATLD